MRNAVSTLLCSVLLLILSACNQSPEPGTAQRAELPSADAAFVAAETEKANAFFEKVFQENLARSPYEQTALGIKDDYDKWNDLTDAFARESHELNIQHLEQLKTLDRSKLSADARISYDLMEQQLENKIDDFKWRFHGFPINQMFGIHSMVPAMLINQHVVSELSDAEAYIARLKGVPLLFEQVEEDLDIRTEMGVIPPRFVFPLVIGSSRNILSGAPFEEGADEESADSAIFADFKAKVAALELDDEEEARLIGEAEIALRDAVKPAYLSLIDYLEELEQRATDTAGAWQFPEGAAFYNNALARTTTTDLTAEEIHQLGLKEVERIHGEMTAIKEAVGFEGDLRAFMDYVKSSEDFLYPNTEAGKNRYLDEATALIETMKGQLDGVFGVKPKADLIVKAVEPFRERAAGKAFYSQPSADGSRPGTYYANLYDMSAMPTYQMEALAYHEGIPGHHMQIAISQELENVPSFRKFGGYTAYIEGWGLYSEYLPKEMGFYKDPYSDFGRLAMELWRACRLVVDTGIHAKKWTRQQGIDYYVNNTPNAEIDAIKMVDRHIVMPSQATAYKIGMLKILELREAAKEKLGDRFDIRGFHDTVLKPGPVPLDVLEQLVEEWVASQG